VTSENISKILYPNDEGLQGKELRLAQQFFFVSCSLQHILSIQAAQNRPLAELHRNFAIQMNDTHPAIAVAELMRLLVDEHAMEWDAAWHVTQNTMSYTNHTLLPEALEQWSRSLFGSLLPRHLEIVEEINRRFQAMKDVWHDFRSSMNAVARGRRRCAWRIWLPSEVMPSMEWPRCIPNY
jgi:starch phosphorylase